MKHKHADLIHAWADGAQIQAKWKDIWLDMNGQFWHDNVDYRVKPETDVVRFISTHEYSGHEYFQAANVRLTFDGDTNKLKKAEVI